MLKEIKIQGFESHLNTTIPLVPGTNVITGTSDSGKSSIRRALAWNWYNSLKGFGFRSDLLNGDDTSTMVQCVFDDCTITRTRDTKTNEYTDFHGVGEPLKALKTGTPQEITEKTRLTPYNMRAQKDVHFLLDDNSGEVARKFNEVAGLQCMDKAFSIINSGVREATAALKAAEEEAENNKAILESLVWTEQATQELDTLRVLTNELSVLKQQITVLQEQIDSIKHLEEALQKYPPPEALQECVELETHELSRRDAIEQKATLFQCKQQIEELSEFLKTPSLAEEALKKLSVLSTMAEKRNGYTQKMDELFARYATCASAEQGLIAARKAVGIAKRVYQKQLEALDVCPLCERSMS